MSEEQPDHLAQIGDNLSRIGDALESIVGRAEMERLTQVQTAPWVEAREQRKRLKREELRANVTSACAILSAAVAVLAVALH